MGEGAGGEQMCGQVNGETFVQLDDPGADIGGQAPGIGSPPLKSQARSPLNRVSFSPEPIWMAYNSSAYLWPSCAVTSAPTSQPAAPYFS